MLSCSSRTRPRARRKRQYSGRQLASQAELAMVAFMAGAPRDEQARWEFRPFVEWREEMRRETPDSFYRRRRAAASSRSTDAAAADDSSGFREKDDARDDSSRSRERTRIGDWEASFGSPGTDR